MIKNQIMVIGPNRRPILPVPYGCNANTPIKIMMVTGTTQCASAGVATEMPSTADSTEIAGVITASP